MKKGPSLPSGRDLLCLPYGRNFISFPGGRDVISLPYGREYNSLPSGRRRKSLPDGRVGPFFIQTPLEWTKPIGKRLIQIMFES